MVSKGGRDALDAPNTDRSEKRIVFEPILNEF
jgi:hypothetical protein